MTRKLCVHCKHYQHSDCWNPMNARESLVDGLLRPRNSTMYLRDDHPKGYETCGPDGAWFEPVEEKAQYGTLDKAVSTEPGDLDVCGRELRPGT